MYCKNGFFCALVVYISIRTRRNKVEYLGGLSVARLASLRHALLREADAEQAQQIAVGRLHRHVRLDQRLKRSNFVNENGHIFLNELRRTSYLKN